MAPDVNEDQPYNISHTYCTYVSAYSIHLSIHQQQQQQHVINIIIYRVGQKSGTHMLYVDICLILVLTL